MDRRGTEDEGAGRRGLFGDRLRGLREAAGLTQEELASLAGLSSNAVGALERGARRQPYPHTVRALSDALKLPEEERAALLAAVPARGGAAPSAAEETSPAAGAPVPALPRPATPLLGREREVEEVGGLLARRDARLLTLTGIGGVGKTRFATKVAREAMENFPDGTAFVGLAPLNDAALVLPTIVRALGLREAEGRTSGEALIDHLREKSFLLLLDNFEHLLEAAPGVAGLIEACPGLVVLATSRAPLRVRGEHEYPVPPLALPSSTRNPTEDDVLNSPSGRLFLERARAASPGFAITPENVAAVAAICWRLAGLPLALELAAAKARFLDPATLLVRLDRALSGAWARDLPERQRTMRATLDWSHGLLSEPERELFRRLSVFAGDLAREAAEAVGATGSIGAEDVLDLLGALVEQSLVVADPSAGGGYGVRYGMLEPVRQYAHERLEEGGEAENARREHARFFLGLADRAHTELMGERQVEWLDRLDRENDNLRAAMWWAVGSGDVETAARLGWALWPFWWVHGYEREAERRWMEAVLEADLSPALRARALVAAGILAFGHGDYERCERYAEEGLELSRRAGDELAEAWARVGLGVAAMARTDQEAATPHLEEALGSLHELDAAFGVARAATCLGMVALMRGEEGEANRIFEEGLTVARRVGDRTTAYVTLYNLSLVALSRGDYDGAAALFEEGVALSEQVGDRASVAYCLQGLAAVEGARGQAEHSARLFGAAQGLLENISAPVYSYYHPDPTLYERTRDDVRSRLGESAFEKAWAEGRAMDFDQAVAYALESKSSTD